MADKYYLKDDSERFVVSGWITLHMLRGAGWAAIVLIAILVFFVALRVVAGFLPEDPFAALDTGGALMAGLA